jgi:hypothetical protein
VEVRDYHPEDRGELEQIHRQLGIDYQFPNLDNPLFFVRKVLEANGRVHSALVLKVCAETFLLLGEGKPQDRFLAMKLLQDSVLTEAYQKGLDEIHATIPEIGFDKRLTQLLWEKDRPGWHLWTRSTLAISAKPSR